ncbi:MAG: hypothetical protein ACKVPX_00170 [Myxococcaceae bacterium]
MSLSKLFTVLALFALPIQSAGASEMSVVVDGIPQGFIRNPDYGESPAGCSVSSFSNYDTSDGCTYYQYGTGAEMSNKPVFAVGYSCDNGHGAFTYAIYTSYPCQQYIYGMQKW